MAWPESTWCTLTFSIAGYIHTVIYWAHVKNCVSYCLRQFYFPCAILRLLWRRTTTTLCRYYSMVVIKTSVETLLWIAGVSDAECSSWRLSTVLKHWSSDFFLSRIIMRWMQRAILFYQFSPSVRPSNADIVSLEWTYRQSFWRSGGDVTLAFLVFFKSYRRYKMPMGTLLASVLYPAGGKICNFRR